MSLNSTPVTTADIEALQLGIQFFENATEAGNEATAINNGTTTVYAYAVQLLASQISVAQVAVADSALMEGATVAAGTAPGAPNTLARFTTQFLPSQVAYGVANGFNPTVFAAQSLGLALANQPGFTTNFAGLSASAFVASVSNITGIHVNALTGWLQYWTGFYTANGTPNGLTVTQAAYGATFGDAVGNALLIKPTLSPANQPIGLPAPPNGPPNFTTLQNDVYNALITNAEGTYTAGVALGSLPIHTPLQGEATNVTTGVFLTQGVDSPTSGFSLTPNGTSTLNGFTATTKGQVLNALPFVVPTSGLSNNTLNTGDNLQTTGAATGATTLNYTTSVDSAAANPPYALNVTLNGVNALNISNQASGPTNISGTPGGTTAGFQGSVTGLTTVVNNSSVNSVQLGAVGASLSTALTSYTSNGGSNQNFTAVIAAAALAGTTDAIGVTLTGNTGAAANPGSFAPFPDLGTVPVGGTSIKLVFAPDSGTNGYETWNITSNNNAFLRLGQGTGTTANGDFGTGIGSANNIVLTGAGSV